MKNSDFFIFVFNLEFLSCFGSFVFCTYTCLVSMVTIHFAVLLYHSVSDYSGHLSVPRDELLLSFKPKKVRKDRFDLNIELCKEC